MSSAYNKQFNFRELRVTGLQVWSSDHMFVLKTLIEKYTQNNPKVLFSCFIDLRKAFDKVRHDGLLYKLRKKGISNLFYNIIKNMYQKTELCVKTDREKRSFGLFWVYFLIRVFRTNI
jgi:hypothetical protein